MRLSPAMKEALIDAAAHPLLRTHDSLEGKPPWPAPATTLHALVRHGLLTHDRRRNRKTWWFDEWTISSSGREALLPPTPRLKPDQPIYLAHPGPSSGDYTHNPARAIDDLETIAPERLDPAWAAQASSSHLRARPAAFHAGVLANRRKAA